MAITEYEVWYNTVGPPVDDKNGILIATLPYGREGNEITIPSDLSSDPSVVPGTVVYYGVRTHDHLSGMYSQFAQTEVEIA
jgi:hypothetical protein